MFQTSLHLSSCKVNNNGFKNIVIPAKRTNTPLNKKEFLNEESRLLHQKNKWVIAHADREVLIKKGLLSTLSAKIKN